MSLFLKHWCVAGDLSIKLTAVEKYALIERKIWKDLIFVLRLLVKFVQLLAILWPIDQKCLQCIVLKDEIRNLARKFIGSLVIHFSNLWML